MANVTWDPAALVNGATLSGGNLTISGSGAGNNGGRATGNQSNGKFYIEFTYTWSSASYDYGGGFTTGAAAISPNPTPGVNLDQSAVIYVNGSAVGNLGSGLTTGTIAGAALDLSNSLVWFRRGPAANWNNSGTANPATGTGGISIPGSTTWFPFAGFTGIFGGQSLTANFGDSAFNGAVPSGFTAGWPSTAGGGGAAQARVLVMA